MEDMADGDYSDSEQMIINDLSAMSLLQHVLFGRLFKTPRNTSKLTGAQKTREWLEGHPVRFYEQLRVDKHTFYLLRDALCERNLLTDTKRMDVNEQLVIFLHTIGHNVRNRVIQDRFQHSGETISRHFKRVLKAINGLRDVYITDPSNEVPNEILGDSRFYPYFKNCMGAIDGTHINAKIKLDKQTPYRNRHGYPSQNVMAVVSFDMTFSYVAAGWEGSASDQAVLRWAVTDGGFVVPKGKFYLVDSGYANTPRFIAPYRGDRYHIGSFRGTKRRYSSEKDLFNHRHAQLRNVVEHTFGVLKARFPILTRNGGIPYPYKKQVQIVRLVASSITS
ncbi:protein ALP1-like isoform X1 [Triticum aestivum]|uniref:protein ALP1-like isoform X1 n=2 Tax=Triticum aestivum TaxID=4565 RepID=UPI001D002746|nr:protein ALP1-like isoform X1 [Triticum aestivum]